MDFQKAYLKLEADEVGFLLEFMFQLTIFGRVVHEEFDIEKKISATKQLNEINHRL